MTNGWVDIKNADVVLVMGGNSAENHPCGFKWVIEAKRNRNAKLVTVDPRFNRTAAVSDLFVQIRAGTDIAFLGGIINYALQNNRYHEEYVKLFTNAPFIINKEFKLPDEQGLFSGFDAQKKTYDKSTWAYEMDGEYAKVDPTLQDPQCVFQLLKKHYSRYTPEVVAKITGASVEAFKKAADIITSTYTPERAGTILYALGWTHHSTGVQIIRAAAMLQLVLGNIGRPGGGLNALRGHSNIQGATDMNQTHTLPGYLKMPVPQWQTLKEYLEATTPKPLRPNSMNYWQNTPKFMVSFLKSLYGEHAIKENDFAYHYLPKMTGNHSYVYTFDDMYRGSVKALVSFGMNPVNNAPNSGKTIAALAKMDWMVMVDNFENESAIFWKAPKEMGGIPPEQIKTEVFLLPAADFAEKDGTFTNSARWLQWKWKAINPPGMAKPDLEILARIFVKVRELYQKEGGKFPDPILHLTWNYTNPLSPTSDELAKEINGKTLIDQVDEKTKQVTLKAGQQLPGFAALKDDGTTVCGNWLHSGYYSEAGNNAARRITADPTGLGMYHNWAFNWPANRRIMYNRASADGQGKPWDPKRPGIAWTGERWAGDVPDYRPDSAPEAGLGAFIMLPEGVAKLYAVDFAEGPFPEHYEALETPVENALHRKVTSNPTAKLLSTDKDTFGKADKFPYVCTTYRLTEHFHFWTKHIGRNVETQPEFFVEIPEELAKEKGIKNQQLVKVTSARGSITGKAMVTKRIRAMMIDGKKVYQIGFPIHWGFAGRTTGPLANFVTPTVLDANSSMPEYKTFLVNLEKA
jgi:formate dehydrogenase major subunit